MRVIFDFRLFGRRKKNIKTKKVQPIAKKKEIKLEQG